MSTAAPATQHQFCKLLLDYNAFFKKEEIKLKKGQVFKIATPSKSNVTSSSSITSSGWIDISLPNMKKVVKVPSLYVEFCEGPATEILDGVPALSQSSSSTQESNTSSTQTKHEDLVVPMGHRNRATIISLASIQSAQAAAAVAPPSMNTPSSTTIVTEPIPAASTPSTITTVEKVPTDATIVTEIASTPTIDTLSVTLDIAQPDIPLDTSTVINSTLESQETTQKEVLTSVPDNSPPIASAIVNDVNQDVPSESPNLEATTKLIDSLVLDEEITTNTSTLLEENLLGRVVDEVKVEEQQEVIPMETKQVSSNVVPEQQSLPISPVLSSIKEVDQSSVVRNNSNPTLPSSTSSNSSVPTQATSSKQNSGVSTPNTSLLSDDDDDEGPVNIQPRQTSTLKNFAQSLKRKIKNFDLGCTTDSALSFQNSTASTRGRSFMSRNAEAQKEIKRNLEPTSPASENTDQPASARSTPKKVQQEKKQLPIMAEETAKRIVFRTLSRFYFIKKFRDYTQKAPELKDFRLRCQTLKEIVATEEHYINSLDTLVKIFVDPLRQKSIFPNESAVYEMFLNVEQIRSTNQVLLRELKDAMSQWPVCRVGKIFVTISPFFKLYTTYINQFDTACSLLEEREKKNKRFADFLQTQQSLPQCHGLTLQSLMIAPVQRLPRYRLLLQDLLKRTPTNHVDYADIEKAYSLIEQVASFVNENKRKDEGYNTINRLGELLKLRVKQIVQPFRSFIRSGLLRVNIHSPTRKIEDVPYHTFVLSDVMVLCQHSITDEDFDPSKAEIIYFAFCKYNEEEGSDVKSPRQELDFSIDAFLRHNYQRFTFKCNSKEERDEWAGDISLAITRCTRGANQKGVSEATYLKRQELSEGVAKQRRIISNANQEIEKLKQSIRNTEVDILSAEKEYETLYARIKSLKAEYEIGKRDFSIASARESSAFAEIEDYTNSIKELDVAIIKALNYEKDAFFEVFEDKPKVDIIQQATENSEAIFVTTQTGDISSEISVTGEDRFRPEAIYYTLDIQNFKIRQNMKESSRPLDRYLSEEETSVVNPLYKIKPLNQWFIIEQESIPMRYKVDRLKVGEGIQKIPPVLLPKDNVYFREDLYTSIEQEEEIVATLPEEEFAEEYREIERQLPSNIDSLKQMILSLMKENRDLIYQVSNLQEQSTLTKRDDQIEGQNELNRAVV